MAGRVGVLFTTGGRVAARVAVGRGLAVGLGA
jgi:hypothetical protein